MTLRSLTILLYKYLNVTTTTYLYLNYVYFQYQFGLDNNQFYLLVGYWWCVGTDVVQCCQLMRVLQIYRYIIHALILLLY